MQAVILIGEQSLRLNGAEINTSLLPVGEHTLFDRLLKALDHNAIRRIVLVSGRAQQQLKARVQTEYPHLNVTWVSNPDAFETGTAYSLWLTHKAIADENILLISGSLVMDARAIARTLNGRGTYEPASVIAFDTSDLSENAIKVEMAEENRITEIGSHLDPAAVTGAETGISCIAAAHLEPLFAALNHRIESGQGRSEHYSLAFNQMIKEKVEFRAVEVTDLPIADIQSIDDYDYVKQEVINRLFE